MADVFQPAPQISAPPAAQPASPTIGSTPTPEPAAPAVPPQSPPPGTSTPAPDDGGEPRSMEDDLHQAYADIQAEEELDGDGRPPLERGPDGKFLPRVKPAAEDPALGAAAPEQSTSLPPGAAPAGVDLNVPPQSLTAKTKAEWANLPEAVRAEFHKREADFHQGIGQYRERAEVAQILWNEIQPYQGIIRSAGSDVPTALRTVLSAAATLHAGTPQQKAALVINILRDHQIDMTPYLQNANAPQGEQQWMDPQVQSLQQQLAQQQQVLQGILGERQQAEQHANAQQFAAARSVVDTFANDPKNLYFSNVSHLMLPLLASGTATSLQQAYEMACRAHPEVHAALLNSVRQRDQEERAAAAARARKLGGQSIRPGPTPGTPNPANASIDETLHARFREITSH